MYPLYHTPFIPSFHFSLDRIKKETNRVSPFQRCCFLSYFQSIATHAYTAVSIGYDIRVYDDELAEALKKLSDRNRENLLMYYFLEMSDTEIAELQNISRSGVDQNRHSSLELMKKILKEEK